MIGSWFCIPEQKLTRETLAEYAEDGFTHFQTLDDLQIGRWTAYSASGNKRALDLCAELGLGCLVVDERVYRGARPYRAEAAPTDADVDAAVVEYRDYPALAGYLLYDEPSPHAFPMLAKTIEAVRERDPLARALVPLFPMHEDPRFPNAFEGRAYEQYLREFVATCRPAVLAYDYYPYFDPPNRMPQFLENLEVASGVAREAGIPFWYYAAIVAGPPAWLPATRERILFQVDAALDHGATAILHYTYHSEHRAPREVVRAVNAHIGDRLG